jgi:hypothetical protein
MPFQKTFDDKKLPEQVGFVGRTDNSFSPITRPRGKDIEYDQALNYFHSKVVLEVRMQENFGTSQ